MGNFASVFGGGGSRPGTGNRGSGGAGPVCPYFSNHMPSAATVPWPTLPLLDLAGRVVRPKAGCSAAVVPLRLRGGGGEVVTGDGLWRDGIAAANNAINNKSSTASSGEDSSKRGDKAGKNKKASKKKKKGPTSVLDDPAVGCCYLIAFDVDEGGRVVPTAKAAAATGSVGASDVSVAGGDAAGGGGGESGGGGGAVSPTTLRKGFNYSNYTSTTSLNALRTRPAAAATVGCGGGGDGEVSTLPAVLEYPGEPRQQQHGASGISSDGGRAGSLAAPLSTVPSHHHNNGHSLSFPPSPPTLAASSTAISFPGIKTVKVGWSTRNPNLSPDFAATTPVAGLTAAAGASVNASAVDSKSSPDGAAASQVSVRSALVRNGPISSSYGDIAALGASANGNANTSIFDATAGGAVLGSFSRQPGARRVVLTTIKVESDTRWCLFNDSRTHEAHIDLRLCASVATGLLLRPTPCLADGGPVKGQKQLAASLPSAATTKAAAAAAASRGSGGSGGSGGGGKASLVATQCYVRVNPKSSVSVGDFCRCYEEAAQAEEQQQQQAGDAAVHSRHLSDHQRGQLAWLQRPRANHNKSSNNTSKKKKTASRVLSVYVVLAPGATLAVAQGQMRGYVIRTSMVPFLEDKSILSLYKGLTAAGVKSMKSQAEVAASGTAPGKQKGKAYAHTALFLSPALKSSSGGDSSDDSDVDDIVSVGGGGPHRLSPSAASTPMRTPLVSFTAAAAPAAAGGFPASPTGPSPPSSAAPRKKVRPPPAATASLGKATGTPAKAPQPQHQKKQQRQEQPQPPATAKPVVPSPRQLPRRQPQLPLPAAAAVAVVATAAAANAPTGGFTPSAHSSAATAAATDAAVRPHVSPSLPPLPSPSQPIPSPHQHRHRHQQQQQQQLGHSLVSPAHTNPAPKAGATLPRMHNTPSPGMDSDRSRGKERQDVPQRTLASPMAATTAGGDDGGRSPQQSRFSEGNSNGNGRSPHPSTAAPPTRNSQDNTPTPAPAATTAGYVHTRHNHHHNDERSATPSTPVTVPATPTTSTNTTATAPSGFGVGLGGSNINPISPTAGSGGFRSIPDFSQSHDTAAAAVVVPTFAGPGSYDYLCPAPSQPLLNHRDGASVDNAFDSIVGMRRSPPPRRMRLGRNRTAAAATNASVVAAAAPDGSNNAGYVKGSLHPPPFDLAATGDSTPTGATLLSATSGVLPLSLTETASCRSMNYDAIAF